jgi:branched-chain amino acid transport system ATP-binding protein
VAYVPQEANVFPTMTIRENLEIGGYLDPAHTRTRIEEMFARFPMLAEKRREAARTLSGGQRQVLAVAIALMVAPVLMLLDEPSAGLSPVAAAGLFDTIRGIRDQGVTVVLVEQNALDALSLADRAYILTAGQNHIEGVASELAADADVRKAFLGG